MKIYQPYTYLIRFKPTNQFYYGAKTAQGCHPDQLWIKYFTSSKYVKKLIKEYGKDSFEIVSIELHENGEIALAREEEYLISVDAGYNPEYLNRTNGNMNWTTVGLITPEETKIKLRHPRAQFLNDNQSILMMGSNNPNYGRYSKDHPCSKKYIITFPDNHEEFIIALPEFCEENNLFKNMMTQVAKGKRNHHHNFKCRYATEREIVDIQPNT